MLSSVSVAELMGRGARFEAHEAVAIAQQLVHLDTTSLDVTPPLGPPSPENVLLFEDGTVRSRGCAITPVVSEIGVLLDVLLPRGGAHVAGGLRYAIARALLEVDAPPFDSAAHFSSVLQRYERGDRREVVRELVARHAAVSSQALVLTPAGDRRRNTPSASDLRRYLREADLALFDQLARERAETPGIAPQEHGRIVPFAASSPTPRAPRRQRPWSRRISGGAALFLLALATVFVAGRGRLPLGDQRVASIGSVSRTLERPAAPAALPETPVTPTPGSDPPPAHAGALAAETHTPPVAAPRARSRDRRAPVPGTPSLVRAVPLERGPAYSPAFESNGTAIFFHTGRSTDGQSALASTGASHDDLRVMTIVNDGAKNYHVQPSPDGTRIAFDSDRDGVRGIYVAERDGTNVRRVSGAGHAAVPTWSPASDRLALVRAEPDNANVWNLWLLWPDSGRSERLTNYRFGQTWAASWLPDGRRICYTHEDRIVLLDLETSESRQYSSPIRGRLVRTPAVSPDGTKVAFQVFGHGIWLLDLTSASMRPILTDPTAEEFAWAPDGRRLAFHSKRDGQWGIWIMAPPVQSF